MLIIHLGAEGVALTTSRWGAGSDPSLSYPNRQPGALKQHSTFGLPFLTASWKEKEEKQKRESKKRKRNWRGRSGIK